MKLDNLELLVKQPIEQLGLEFWGLELVPGLNKPTLRIYIETLESAGRRVSADDCQEVSYKLNTILAVENNADNPEIGLADYILEVSSPGLDRILFKPAQFMRYIGEIINLRLINPVENRSKFKGVLVAVDLEHENSLKILVDGIEFKVLFNNIAKARLVPSWN